MKKVTITPSKECDMAHSFFVKYYDYRAGIRFVIDGSRFFFLHNVEREPEDEVFAKGLVSLLDFQKRLKAIFGVEQGKTWFAHFVQELIFQCERAKRRKKK